MKYCRFLLDGQIRYGAVTEDKGEFWISEPAPAPAEDLLYRLELEQADADSFDFQPMRLVDAELLPPVTPSKIICIGRNYREHAKELGNEAPANPILFFKPPSSLLAPGGTIKLPKAAERVDYEGEIGLIVGRKVRNLPADTPWRSVIRGFTLANDITARDLQKKDAQWARAKGFDTFCPVGPIVSDELDLDKGLNLQTRVNGELKQDGNTLDFIFDVPTLLSHITAAFTLEPGDLILTGTPAGVTQLQAGEYIEVSSPGLGILRNSVAAE